MMLKKAINKYFSFLCYFIAVLVPCGSGITANMLSDIGKDGLPVYSLVLSVREFANNKQILHNGTHSEAELACYLSVNHSDSEDLYRKAASNSGCTLLISGNYLIDKPLGLSVRIEAVAEAALADDSHQDLFIPVRQEQKDLLTTDFSLLTPVAIQTSLAVLPGAVLTIDSTEEESYLTLLSGSSLSGVGIRTVNGALHESGCTLSGVYFQDEIPGDVYWLHSQLADLCSRQHIDLNDATLGCKGPRECGGGKRRRMNGGGRDSSTAARQKRQPDPEPVDEASNGHGKTALASASGGNGGGGKKGNGRKDDEYKHFFSTVEDAYQIYKKSEKKQQHKTTMKNVWSKVPRVLRPRIQEEMSEKYSGFAGLQRDLKLN